MAETFQLANASSAAFVVRGILAELRGISARDSDLVHQSCPVVLATDCKGLYDCLHGQRGAPDDRRVTLEIALLKDDVERGLKVVWLPTGQQVADGLTKQLGPESRSYLQEVMQSGKWCLGPDRRVPKDRRGRVLVDEFAALPKESADQRQKVATAMNVWYADIANLRETKA